MESLDVGVLILVTGAAGFIGVALGERLLSEGRWVVGLDNINKDYDPLPKHAQLKELPGFRFVKLDIADREVTAAFFVAEPFGRVLHLAVQAGFRYSLLSLHAYLDSNPVVFLNVLKGCWHNPLQHLVYALSSSA